jgi:hypothetical protein
VTLLTFHTSQALLTAVYSDHSHLTSNLSEYFEGTHLTSTPPVGLDTPRDSMPSPPSKVHVNLKTPHKFFKVGRVFQDDIEVIYVVVREGYGSSTCCKLQLLRQDSTANYSLPNIGAIYLPGSPGCRLDDNQYHLILECPTDDVSPPYHVLRKAPWSHVGPCI